MWQWITAINHTNMKNVLSTGITSSSQQPYTKTTHEWYNAMSKDVAEAFVKSLIPSSAYTGKLVILSGCELTGTNPGARTVSDGFVWYNGEIFRVVAGTFTTTGSEIGVWSINTASTNLIFSDGASKPVHQEKTLVLSNGESGSQLFDEGSSDVISTVEGYTVKSTIPNVKVTKIDIGNWDMDADDQKNVSYSGVISDITKIVSAQVMIQSDSGSINYPLDIALSTDSFLPQGGWGVFVSGSAIGLFRKTGGVFDAFGFTGSGNRGYITIFYLA